MDYEKKYNEALKWMRELYPGLHGATKEDAEHYFPELRESEDDGIYREIYSIVHHHYERRVDLLVSHRDRNEMLEKWEKAKSFLEKQKESHIPWYDYQKSKEAGYTIVPNEEYERLIKQKEQEPQVFCEAKAYDLGYKQGKEDAIKEQKPAEWSEEDERIRKAILGFLNPDKGGTKYSSNAELVEWSDWLKSLRPSWKPSEEQMKVFQNTMQRLLQAGGTGKWYAILESLYEQLKKL